jgi:hypothetical protein
MTQVFQFPIIALKIIMEISTNTLQWFWANQLILNMEKTTTVKFAPSNRSYFPLHITSAEQLSVEINAITFSGTPNGQSPSMGAPYNINYLLHNLSSVCYIRR